MDWWMDITKVKFRMASHLLVIGWLLIWMIHSFIYLVIAWMIIDLLIGRSIDRLNTSTPEGEMDWATLEKEKVSGWSWKMGEGCHGNGRLRWLKNNDQKKTEECFNYWNETNNRTRTQVTRCMVGGERMNPGLHGCRGAWMQSWMAWKVHEKHEFDMPASRNALMQKCMDPEMHEMHGCRDAYILRCIGWDAAILDIVTHCKRSSNRKKSWNYKINNLFYFINSCIKKFVKLNAKVKY